ncbi:SRPBCC domain-containing protein [soil metagenome]
MKYSIRQLYHINAPKQKVYEAITTIDGLKNWWTTQVEGSAETGGTLQFNFGDFKGPLMKVTELKPTEKLGWECVGETQEWKGNTFTFSLDENEGKTRVRFSHDGWEAQDDFYASCCYSWGRYLESLRQYCQTGKGEAFGSEGYRK